MTITTIELSGNSLIKGILQLLFKFFILPKIEYVLDLINLYIEGKLLDLLRKR